MFNAHKYPTTFDDLDHTGTLFDPANFRPDTPEVTDADYAALEHLVDTQPTNYYTARRTLSLPELVVQAPPEVDAPELKTRDTTPGVSVDLGERANYLLHALSAYCRTSRLEGLSSVRESPDIQRRYTDNQLDRMIGAMTPIERRGYDSFYMASGAVALKASGMPPQQVDSDVLCDSQRFANTYTGPTNRSAREKFKRRLEKQIPHVQRR